MQRKKRQIYILCVIFLMVLLTGAGMLALADETEPVNPPVTQDDPDPNQDPDTGATSDYVPVETPSISIIDPIQTPTPDTSSIAEPTPTTNTEPTPTPNNEPEITPTPPDVQQSTPTPYVPQNTEDDDDDSDDYNNTAGTVNNQQTTSTPSPTPSASPQAGTIERPKVTLSPSEESTSETKESDYVEFAKVNIRQNALASNMFYGGVALIALGVTGLIVLIVLFIKNRRYARNANEGIFEEIEEAEIRGYYPESVPDYEDVDANAVYDDDPYAQYANTGDVIIPESSSIYTGEFEPISSYEDGIYEDAPPFEHHQESGSFPSIQPDSAASDPVPNPDSEPVPQPVSPPKPPQKPGYTTEEILREYLNTEKDGHAY